MRFYSLITVHWRGLLSKTVGVSLMLDILVFDMSSMSIYKTL